MFSGRQIHPFFMSRKGGKTSQSLTDPESNWSSIGRKEKGVAFNPIHVYENVQVCSPFVFLQLEQRMFFSSSATHANVLRGDFLCKI